MMPNLVTPEAFKRRDYRTIIAPIADSMRSARSVVIVEVIRRP